MTSDGWSMFVQVKIRFQSVWGGEPKPYSSTVHAFVDIYKTEGGLRGLYRGLSPTVVRASILTAAQLSSYDTCKRHMLRSGQFEDNVKTHLIASLVSGLVTSTVTNPVDVCKTRIMSDSKGTALIVICFMFYDSPDMCVFPSDCRGRDTGFYKGPWHCVAHTFQAEGLRAFMKGWSASFARLGPHFCMR